MSTVNELMLRLALRVDPRIKSTGVEFTTSTIGVSEGDTFSAQRLLDVYNEARITLAASLVQGKIVAPEGVGGIVKTAATSFSDGAPQTAAKPSDYLAFVAMTQGIVMLDPTMYPVVAAKEDPNYTESLTNKFVFEVGASFVHLGGFITINPTLVYFGLQSWALSDVLLATTATETIDRRYEPNLLELAVAISNGMGALEANSLAKKLLGG